MNTSNKQDPIEVETSVPQGRRITKAAWVDLGLYLLLGLGLLFAVSILFGMQLQEITLGVSILLYSVNVLFLFGSVVVVGKVRGSLALGEVGFWPVRWKMKWILAAVGLTLGLLPLRMILGTLALELFDGGMEGLEMRMDVFLPGGLTLHGFVLTLFFTGILVPIAEEMYFRGALYGWLRKHVSYPAALAISTLLFGLGHMDSIAVALSSMVLGFANAVLYERTRSIWAPIAVHALNNSLAMMVIYASMYAVEQGLVPA